MAGSRLGTRKLGALVSSLVAACVLLLSQAALAGPPVVTNPGTQTNVEGDSVNLPIVASDPDGDPLTYSASGLPRRIEIDPDTGVICCSINIDDVAGTYTASVGVSDGTSTTNIQFTWIVTPGVLGTGDILHEWWDATPGITVQDLTSSPDYPDNPSGSEVVGPLASLELPVPANPVDHPGSRLRGYLHPDFTGNHRFSITANDSAELWLSNSDLPSGASLIASTAGNPQSFNIFLEAGERYYIEVIHVGDTIGDFMTVDWLEPGGAWERLAHPHISQMDFVPVWGQLKDQGSHEGSGASVTVSASDPNEDSLSYSLADPVGSPLPPGLSIDPVTGEISGSIGMGAVGSYPVDLRATDPSGNFADGQFIWEVVPFDSTLITPVNRGVACQDEATGTGYLMYSIVDVRQSKRFFPNKPVSQNAAHFVCVKFMNGQWFYDDNDDYHPLRLWGSDVLVARINHDADPTDPDRIVSLDLSLGVEELSTYEGVISGYESGNVGFIGDWYDGEFARGEFTVTGSHFYPARYPLVPELPALPGWSRAAVLALILAFGHRVLQGRRRSC